MRFFGKNGKTRLVFSAQKKVYFSKAKWENRFPEIFTYM